MTTIIARNGELVADRRKVVNGRRVGIIGVRNEAKIHKLPYCIYGITGFETDESVGIGRGDYFLKSALATLFALSYICEKNKEKDEMLLEKTGWTRPDYTRFRIQLAEIRNVIGTQLAKELQEAGQGVIAMGLFNTIHIQNGTYLTIPITDTVVGGCGTTEASILLDNGRSYKEIYHMLRTSGAPTGIEFDVLSVEKDLDKLFPPLSDPGFIRTIGVISRMAIKREKAQGDDVREKEVTYALVEVMATFLMMGRVRDGKWRFFKDPVLKWISADLIKKHYRVFKIACDTCKVKFEDYLKTKEGGE